MSALSTAEAALRRAPDDPAVPITISGAEAAALIAELDGLRVAGDQLAAVARILHDQRSTLTGEKLQYRWLRLAVKTRAWIEARHA